MSEVIPPHTDVSATLHRLPNGTWQSWFEAYGRQLLLFARQWATSAASAEDIVQDAFVRFWRSPHRNDAEAHVQLFAMVRRAGLDHVRARSRRTARELDATGDRDAVAWFATDTEERDAAIRAALPSRRLASHLATALAEPPASPPVGASHGRRPTRWREVSLWLSWGVAAAMTVAFFTRTPPAPAMPAGGVQPPAPVAAPSSGAEPADGPARFEPASTTNTLISALDEGVVLLEDGQPARKVRYEFLDSVDLRSTADPSATIVVTTPREEIRLVPLQVY